MAERILHGVTQQAGAKKLVAHTINMAAHTSKRQPMLAIHMANPERPHGQTDPRPPYHRPL